MLWNTAFDIVLKVATLEYIAHFNKEIQHKNLQEDLLTNQRTKCRENTIYNIEFNENTLSYFSLHNVLKHCEFFPILCCVHKFLPPMLNSCRDNVPSSSRHTIVQGFEEDGVNIKY